MVASPWYFPRPEEYRTLLDARGFELYTLDFISRPTLLRGDIGAWPETFAQPYTCALSETDKQSFIPEITHVLRPVLCDRVGNWHADYVRLRFSATKPADIGQLQP